MIELYHDFQTVSERQPLAILLTSFCSTMIEILIVDKPIQFIDKHILVFDVY